MRLLPNDAATLSVTFFGQDEETPAAQSNVSVTITDAYEELVASGTAFLGSGTGVYSYALVPLQVLGDYTVKWWGNSDVITQSLTVVGSHIATVAELRTLQPTDLGNKKPDNSYVFPSSVLKAARDIVAVEFEDICSRSFIKRSVVETVAVKGGSAVLSRGDVISVDKVDGQVFAGSWKPYGVVYNVSGDFVKVEYTYGLQIVPADIKYAAAMRARYLVTQDSSNISARAVTYTPESGGSYTLAVAGRAGQFTGIPDVDTVLNRYKLRTMPVIR